MSPFTSSAVLISGSEDSEPRYWFYAKEYGFGWGLPASWQGWVVFVGFFVLILGGIPLADSRNGPGFFLVYLGVLVAILFAICWWKGEPLAWRWGERTEETRAIYRDAPRSNKRDARRRGYLVLHLFLGPVILVAGCWMYLSPPAKANHTYGYRTAASFQSQDAWDEAQRFSAGVLMGVALVTLACQATTALAMKPVHALIVSSLVMALGLIAVIPITESHLRDQFDGHGRKIARQTVSE